MSNWSGGFIDWTDGTKAYLSVVFSWQLPIAYMRAAWFWSQNFEVHVGGPAVDFRPDYFGDLATVGKLDDVVHRHNPLATFTSRGCPMRCPFCIVPKIEGELQELKDWPIRPIVCDNNLLACSRAHFDDVIDKLKPLQRVDFNQGLDHRLLTTYHAQRLAELDSHCIRLAWDHAGQEVLVLKAIDTLKRAGFPPSHIRVYVLIGYKDTPEEANFRLQTIRDLSAQPWPMRYQPLDSDRKNSYVAPNWTERQLRNVSRYWSRIRYFGGVPFPEWRPGKRKRRPDNPRLFKE